MQAGMMRNDGAGQAMRLASNANVGDVERIASGIAGALFTAWGLQRRSVGGTALAAAGAALLYRGISGQCHMYHALGIDTSNGAHGAIASVHAGAGVKVEECFTVTRPASELFRFWRRLENLPRFMTHLESVRETEPGRSVWVAKGPVGVRVEWTAEIHNEKENRLIAWRSVGESDVDTAGSVHFDPAPGDRGTEVRVVLKYDPPAGKAGAFVARMFGEAPEQQVGEELRRFKQLMEAGEIATIQGQTSCRGAE